MRKYTKQISVVNAIFSRHYFLPLAEVSSWKYKHTHSTHTHPHRANNTGTRSPDSKHTEGVRDEKNGRRKRLGTAVDLHTAHSPTKWNILHVENDICLILGMVAVTSSDQNDDIVLRSHCTLLCISQKVTCRSTRALWVLHIFASADPTVYYRNALSTHCLCCCCCRHRHSHGHRIPWTDKFW